MTKRFANKIDIDVVETSELAKEAQSLVMLMATQTYLENTKLYSVAYDANFNAGRVSLDQMTVLNEYLEAGGVNIEHTYLGELAYLYQTVFDLLENIFED
jgi:hypothetical protein